VTTTATVVSAATKQHHYQNDNQDQFHDGSPLTVWLNLRTRSFNGVFHVLFPTSVHASHAVRGRM
jgi:hypothetical protein